MRLFIMVFALFMPTLSVATNLNDLNRELDRIIGARGYSTVLGIQVTQLGFAEDAFLEKMQFIAPENYSDELKGIPFLSEKISKAQKILFEAFLSLEQYRSRYVDESQRRYEKLSAPEKEYFDKVDQLLSLRTHTERLLSLPEPQGSILNVAPLKDVILDLKEAAFHNNTDLLEFDPANLAQVTTAQQFLRRPRHLRITSLKTLSSEAFTAFLFSLVARSPKENGMYLPAAIKVISEEYDFSRFGKQNKLLNDTPGISSLDRRLVSVYQLIMRTANSKIIDNGTANILEYSSATKNTFLDFNMRGEYNSSVYLLFLKLKDSILLSEKQAVLKQIEALKSSGKKIATSLPTTTKKDLFKFATMNFFTKCQLLMSEVRD